MSFSVGIFFIFQLWLWLKSLDSICLHIINGFSSGFFHVVEGFYWSSILQFNLSFLSPHTLSIYWHFCANFVPQRQLQGLQVLQYHLIASFSLSGRVLYAASEIVWHLAWNQWSHRSHFNPWSPSRTGSVIQGIVSDSSDWFVDAYCLVFLSAILPLLLLFQCIFT